jgi:hypothetical protein
LPISPSSLSPGAGTIGLLVAAMPSGCDVCCAFFCSTATG